MNAHSLVRIKLGDLIRFRPPYYISSVDGVNSINIEGAPWYMGLLVECEKISRLMCTVFYDGQTFRIPIHHIQLL